MPMQKIDIRTQLKPVSACIPIVQSASHGTVHTVLTARNVAFSGTNPPNAVPFSATALNSPQSLGKWLNFLGQIGTNQAVSPSFLSDSGAGSGNTGSASSQSPATSPTIGEWGRTATSGQSLAISLESAI